MSARKLREHLDLRASLVDGAIGFMPDWCLSPQSLLASARDGITVWPFLLFCIPACWRLSGSRDVRGAARSGQQRIWNHLFAVSAD